MTKWRASILVWKSPDIKNVIINHGTKLLLTDTSLSRRNIFGLVYIDNEDNVIENI